MEQKYTVFQTITQRVRNHVNSTLSDSKCLQLAIAAAMRDHETVSGFLLPHHLAKQVDHCKHDMGLRPAEWNQIFGANVSPIKDAGMGEFVASSCFQEQPDKLENALKLTLQEHEQSLMWKKPWHRLVLYIAMHVEYSDDAIFNSLGTVIKADQRRIEDYINEIDDSGVETLAFSRAIELVSNAILGC